MSRFPSRSLLGVALLLAHAAVPGALAQGPSSDQPDEPRVESPSAPTPSAPPTTPVRLFAAVEDAWISVDAEAFAALVDTTAVRIALKPGATPTTAPTRSAAAFLFQDQLRLVTSQTFQIRKVGS